jgi:hypothetical protein
VHAVRGAHADDYAAGVGDSDGGPRQEWFPIITLAIAVQVVEGQDADGASGRCAGWC